MELGPNQREWIAALRSGRYGQTQKVLRDKDGFCCLGVACHLFDPDMWEPEDNGEYCFDNENAALPDCVVHHLGLFGQNGDANDDISNSCADMNDHNCYSFIEIADRLERHPEVYFKEAR